MNKEVSSHKKDFLIASLVLIAIGFMVFVLADLTGVTLNTPVANANISGTYLFNATITGTGADNVTFYHNQTGSWVAFCFNDSAGTEFICTNDTNTVSFPDGTYSFNATARNGTTTTSTTTVSGVSLSVTVDNTAPNVSSFYTTLDNTNHTTGTIVLNVSVSDTTIGMGYVYFRITHSNGTLVTGNFTKATNVSGPYYNLSVDITGFQDGYYNITVYANDSARSDGNTKLNSSEHIQIAIDDTAPSSVTLTSANDSRSSITATISAVDATTGISGKCSVDRSLAVVTGTGASQILREDNLVCGQSYPYVVTCTDYNGYSKASATTTFTTDACSGGGGGGSGTTATYTWTNTYTTSDAQFTEGFTKQLSVKNRVRVTVSGMSHHVGVKEVSATSATIEIASEPVEVNLDVGEDAKVDVTDDRYYDIYVKLNAIVDGKADVTVMKINEEIPEDVEGSVDTNGDIVGTTTPDTGADTTDDEGGLTWLWIVIGILVLAAIVGGGVAVKKKQ